MFTDINNTLKKHESNFDKFHEVNRGISENKGICDKLKSRFEALAKDVDQKTNHLTTKQILIDEKLT